MGLQIMLEHVICYEVIHRVFIPSLALFQYMKTVPSCMRIVNCESYMEAPVTRKTDGVF